MNVIVIGAGILGAATAYQLAKKGVDVTIIDRDDRGQATAVAAGMICPWISQRRNKAWYKLVKNGAKFYPELVEQLKELVTVDIGYKRVGALSIDWNMEKLDKTEERVRKRYEDAPEIGEIRRLSPAQAKEFVPIIAEYGAVYVSGAARVNGKALRDALLQAAMKLGASFIQGDATLTFTKQKVDGVVVNGEKKEADRVIVTAGAWARTLIKPLGISFLIKPQKAQIIHLRIDEKATGNWPAVMFPSNKYMLPFEDGRIVVGTTYESDAGFDLARTTKGVYEILDAAVTHAPALISSTIEDIYVGFRPIAPGYHPIIGPLPGYDGILVANGLGATGLTAGPYLGKELANIALGEETKLDLTEYDVMRAIGKTEDETW